MRWSCGADGRVPRLAQRRVICSSGRSWLHSPNQTSTSLRPMPCSHAIKSRRAGRFFKSLDRAFGLRMVARPRRQLAKAHPPQLAAQRLLGHLHPALLPEPLAQVDDPPAHHAVHQRDGAGLDHRRHRRPIGVGQPRWLPGRLAVEQARRPGCVELNHPVPHDLQRRAADPRGIGATAAVVDHGKRKQTPGLRTIFRPTCGGTDLVGIWGARARRPRSMSRNDLAPTHTTIRDKGAP